MPPLSTYLLFEWLREIPEEAPGLCLEGGDVVAAS